MAAYDFPDTTGRPTDGSFVYTAPTGEVYSWNGYAWVSASGTNISGYVKKAGDTMSGALSVPANAISTQVPQVQEVVQKTGDTMSGDLTVPNLVATNDVTATGDVSGTIVKATDHMEGVYSSTPYTIFTLQNTAITYEVDIPDWATEIKLIYHNIIGRDPAHSVLFQLGTDTTWYLWGVNAAGDCSNKASYTSPSISVFAGGSVTSLAPTVINGKHSCSGDQMFYIEEVGGDPNAVVCSSVGHGSYQTENSSINAGVKGTWTQATGFLEAANRPNKIRVVSVVNSVVFDGQTPTFTPSGFPLYGNFRFKFYA
jgi:hypothetical protein